MGISIEPTPTTHPPPVRRSVKGVASSGYPRRPVVLLNHYRAAQVVETCARAACDVVVVLRGYRWRMMARQDFGRLTKAIVAKSCVSGRCVGFGGVLGCITLGYLVAQSSVTCADTVRLSTRGPERAAIQAERTVSGGAAGGGACRCASSATRATSAARVASAPSSACRLSQASRLAFALASLDPGRRRALHSLHSSARTCLFTCPQSGQIRGGPSLRRLILHWQQLPGRDRSLLHPSHRKRLPHTTTSRPSTTLMQPYAGLGSTRDAAGAVAAVAIVARDEGGIGYIPPAFNALRA